MTDQSALESMDSFEQTNFLAVTDYLAARICSHPNVKSAEGMDGANTENSSLITGCQRSQAEYLGELLARYAHQKWILIFNPAPASKGHLFIVTFTTEHPGDVAKELRSHGIKAGTIVIEEKLVRFYLWASDNSQDGPVHAYATAIHGQLEEMPGEAIFIGDDSRAKAQQVFDRRIRDYERAHHKSFSKLLWSKRLHDMGITSSH